MTTAWNIHVRGIVQGVGFRPFVVRLAQRHAVAGWVLNNSEGVELHVEGIAAALPAFLDDLQSHPPPAARIESIDVAPVPPAGFRQFTIRTSQHREAPTTPISPDLPVCAACLQELFDLGDPRFHYPYLNCTDCGPRYSVILALPYDRPNTTMKGWAMDALCAAQYHDCTDRRFHAQPIACPNCGPHLLLRAEGEQTRGDEAVLQRSVELLQQGRIVAIKGLGGYHLACDARNAAAVAALRERKFRKEKPFALMLPNLAAARRVVRLRPKQEALLTSPARPIVLAQARMELPGVAPGHHELGVMLPATPVQHLLFALGAPDVLVMTSANRSSEPIAYEDDDAMARLSGIADAFLIGERPVARRVDDSVARCTAFGPMLLRRARGYAPAAAATLPGTQPILAVGADLKNAITLVINGQAMVSQHIGDLEHAAARQAFHETIRDLTTMYAVDWQRLLVVHDLHPEYTSTLHAQSLPAARCMAVQHHRAHVASVLAEHGAWEERVLGASFDGTGYGDDGGIWGGEFFLGSLSTGLERVAHLRPARLAGGDAAARCPAQAAAGFLAQLENLPDLTAAPFYFPARYGNGLRLIAKNLRTFLTTSMGRLFDTAAALLGFTHEITYEGQAAIWLEQQAQQESGPAPYPFPFDGRELDFRPLLQSVLNDRLRGRGLAAIARAFHDGVAAGLCEAIMTLCGRYKVSTVVLSGGVFQNALLLDIVHQRMRHLPLRLWTNHAVPPNDGGISLGQAAWVAVRQ
jgi:hydrogenase maturation protein HypF